MRVLIPNHFPLEGSGSGIYTQNVARELANKGHEALTITPGHDEQTGFPFEVRTILFSPDEGHTSPERLPFNFPCFTTHPLSTTTFADLDNAQRETYIEAFRSAMDFAVSEWKPDVIHAQHLWVTSYVAKLTGLPYVVTAHGTDLMGFRKYDAWRPVALEGALSAGAIIAVSQQVARDTIELYGVREEQVHLVWNGFDQDIFHVMSVDQSEVLTQHGLPPDPEYVISFVGKLTHFKGVDVLLDAAVSYERELGEVFTLIVGDGELRKNLEEHAERLGLRGVYFLGHQTQPEVAKIFNLADVSVVPSRVEPFGLVAVEALACGIPVVATNEGGLPDFIDERVGALVDVGDHDQLAEKIVNEVKGDAKAMKGPFAAEYALNGFSWASQVDKMISIYEEAYTQA
ncbi:MAG TPA: glycosyltransferase family 4 protein [Anaerolineae bacterium]|nr:glycosyltransferase family 4 protein [Anaerolineae bacterium]